MGDGNQEATTTHAHEGKSDEPEDTASTNTGETEIGRSLLREQSATTEDVADGDGTASQGASTTETGSSP